MSLSSPDQRPQTFELLQMFDLDTIQYCSSFGVDVEELSGLRERQKQRRTE
ncbi:hypothetical protein QTP86_034244 [Hemibagrus guttatus]|nr:hypothetical protein QTP86_034244 [Hemibagrus guttatus]